jgi:Holliday junction DNA helicase RuvA
MIARLSGTISAISPPELILDVGDIAYEILCPLPTFYQIQTGDKITLNTHLSIKEDSHTLFGFLKTPDKTMFRELIKVSGIGPKVALAILSHLSSNELSNCIVNEDDNLIAKTPGIGKKTAQKLIIELKPKIAKLEFTSNKTSDNKAKEALLALGFKDKEISQMLKGADGTLSTEELIKYALKNK